ncbi:MAG: flagellar hook-length control protein FliK [Sulfuriferula sp.]
MNFPRAEVTGTRPVTLIQALPPTSSLGDTRDELLHRLTQISLGQELVANVQAKLSDGSFLVRLADTVAKMNLPASTEVGAKLNLTLVNKEPRPTFVVNELADSANSTPTQISNTAHLITTLLQNSSNQPPAMVIAKSDTVMMRQNTPPQVIAQTLQLAITQSGVFYESHLASWVSGQMNIAQLMQEPQAQLSPHLGTPPRPLSESNIQPPSKLPDILSNQTLQNLANTQRQGMEQNHIASPDVLNNPTLQHLVNTQLQTLEQNHIVWQGNAWPGQAMQWTISQDTPQHEQQQSAPQSTWRSDVKFELPALGKVTATLRLSGEHLSVQIHTEDAGTANKLQANTALLISALSAAGIPLDAILIKPSEPTDHLPADLSK